MHCDPTTDWPTAAAEVLTTVFPDLVAETSNSGLTARQTFEQGIDSEEPVKPSLAKSSNEERHQERRGKSDDHAKYQDGAAAARAGTSGRILTSRVLVDLIYLLCNDEAAIAHSKKKKTPKASKEGSSMAPYMWAALVFAILAVLNAVFSSHS